MRRPQRAAAIKPIVAGGGRTAAVEPCVVGREWRAIVTPRDEGAIRARVTPRHRVGAHEAIATRRSSARGARGGTTATEG